MELAQVHRLGSDPGLRDGCVASRGSAVAAVRRPRKPAVQQQRAGRVDNGAPGLYVEIGHAVAEALGRPMETVWSLSYFGKRNIRTTLLAGQCDLVVGLPADSDFMGTARDLHASDPQTGLRAGGAEGRYDHAASTI